MVAAAFIGTFAQLMPPSMDRAGAARYGRPALLLEAPATR